MLLEPHSNIKGLCKAKCTLQGSFVVGTQGTIINEGPVRNIGHFTLDKCMPRPENLCKDARGQRVTLRNAANHKKPKKECHARSRNEGRSTRETGNE